MKLILSIVRLFCIANLLYPKLEIYYGNKSDSMKKLKKIILKL